MTSKYPLIITVAAAWIGAATLASAEMPAETESSTKQGATATQWKGDSTAKDESSPTPGKSVSKGDQASDIDTAAPGADASGAEARSTASQAESDEADEAEAKADAGEKDDGQMDTAREQPDPEWLEQQNAESEALRDEVASRVDEDDPARNSEDDPIARSSTTIVIKETKQDETGEEREEAE